MESDKIVQALDELAAQARGEASIYGTAATNADGLSLTAFSVSCAVQCRACASELEGIAMLYRNGSKPLPHRFARVVRACESLVTSAYPRDDVEIVEICNRQNDAALRAYERALHLPLPGTLRTALNNHLITIRERYRRLLPLRRQLQQRAALVKAAATQVNAHASGD